MFVQSDLDVIGSSIFDGCHFQPVGDDGRGGCQRTGCFYASVEQKISEMLSSERQFIHDLKRGDTVTIQSGPFGQYNAIFDTRISGTDRVRILLKLLADRLVPIELNIHKLKE